MVKMVQITYYVYTEFLDDFLSESLFLNEKLIDADFVVKCQNQM